MYPSTTRATTPTIHPGRELTPGPRVAPRPPLAAATARADRAPLGQDEHRRQHGQHPEQRDGQVDHGHQAEVAQHLHVGEREHREAGDRRRARGRAPPRPSSGTSRRSASSGVRARARAPPGSGAASSTANSVEIAITSAPSVADIGLSGIRSANSTSADHPVASAIGDQRHPGPLPAPVDREQREADGEQAGEQRRPAAATATTASRSPPRRAPAARRAARSRPAAGPAGGACPARSPAGASSGISRTPNARFAVFAVAGDHGLGEVRRHRVEQAVDLRPRRRRRVGAEQVGERERRAQLGLPQPRLAL